METYACVRTDNLSGTVEGKNLVSLKYSGTIENGTILKVGNYIDGEREVRAATIPAVSDALSNLALVATPEVIKDKLSYNVANFINEAGSVIRGYRLCANDIFSVTSKAFATGQTPLAGNIVEMDGLGKLLAVSTATTGSTKIGEIKKIEGEWFVIEVAG